MALCTFSSTKSLINKVKTDVPELTGLTNYYLFNTTDLSYSNTLSVSTNLFNYSFGTQFYDASLSSTSAINTTTYKYGTGSLDASGYYLKINNNPTTGASGVSISFWMRGNALTSPLGYSPIFDFGNVSATVSNTISLSTYGNLLTAKVSTGFPSPTFTNLTTNAFGFNSTNNSGLAVNQHGNIMLFSVFNSGTYANGVWYSKYTTSWSAPQQVYSVFGPNGIALTADGKRGVFVVRDSPNNYIYHFDANDVSFNTPIRSLGAATTRSYTCIDITADGNRVVTAAYVGGVYFSNWDTTNNKYNEPTATSAVTRRYWGCAITSDGSRIAYTDSSGYVYLATWNGTSTYIGETTINPSNSLGECRSVRFARNGHIIYVIRNQKSQNALQYSVWRGSSYDNSFVAVSSTYTPVGTATNGYEGLGLSVSYDGTAIYCNNYFDALFCKTTATYSNETILQNFYTTGLHDNTWKNITWTIAANGTYTFYLNNTAIYTSGSGLTYPTATLRGRNYIGYSYDLSLALFGGYIDDFRFYNSTLSVSDVSAIYNNSSPPTANLLNYYKFDLTDITYNTYNSYMLNRATSTTYDASLSDTTMISSSSYVEGTAALNVTSLTKKVKLTSAISLGSSGFTASFWLKSTMNSGYKPIFNIGNGKYNNNITYGILGNTIITDTTSDVSFGAVSIDASSSIVLNRNSVISIGVTSDGKRLAVSTYETSGTLWSTTLNNSSNTFTPLRPSETSSFIISGTRSSRLSADGNVAVIVTNPSQSGLVYTSRWINGNCCYGPLTSIDATARNYMDADISADGNWIGVCVYNGVMYYSTWNGTAYTSLTATTDGNSRLYRGITISSDGTNLIGLVETSPFTLHLSTWNGTNFAYKGALTSNISRTGRRCKLSYDNSVIFCTTDSLDTTASLYYTQWNGVSYNTSFTAVSTSYIPASIDTWGLAIDASNNVYACNLNLGAGVSTIYKIHFSLSKKTTNNVVSDANINDNTWRHHALTVSNTGTYKHYIDGGLVNTSTGVAPANISRSTNFIGYTVDLSSGDISGAMIDDFRIYNRVVSNNDMLTKLYKPVRKVAGVVGGSLVSNSTYTLYKFQDTSGNISTGSITISGSRTIYYVMVGGGGSSASRGGTQSNYHGAGGGGGGVVTGSITQSQTMTYNIIVGRGGAAEAPSSNTTVLYANSPYAKNVGAYGECSQIIYGSTILYANGGAPSTTYTTATQDVGGTAGTTTKGLAGVANVTESGTASNGANGGASNNSGYTITIGTTGTTTTYNIGGGGSGGGTGQSIGVNTYGGGNGGTTTTPTSSGLHGTGGGGGGGRGYNGSTNALNFSHGGTGIVLIFFAGAI